MEAMRQRLLAQQLGLGAGDAIAFPHIAYPTYDIGARAVGATPYPADDPDDWPAGTRLVWVNSPSNPSGRVLGAAHLRKVVEFARERGDAGGFFVGVAHHLRQD